MHELINNIQKLNKTINEHQIINLQIKNKKYAKLIDNMD